MFKEKWGVLAENFGAEIEFIQIFSSQEEAQSFKKELDEDGYYYHTALLTPERVKFYEEEEIEPIFRF